MQRLFLCFIIVFSFVMINSSITQAQELSGIGPESIWKPGDEKIMQMREECAKNNYPIFEKCLIEKMKEYGASPKALEFTQLLMKEEYPFCFMNSFRNMGIVDVTEVSCPFMANTMGFTLLVNGDPRIVQPGKQEYLNNIDISKDPLYPSIVKEFPKTTLWFRGNFVKMENTSSNGQRFVWKHLVMNGCSACEVAGSATVAYDFDKTGKFVGTKLLMLKAGE